MSKTCFQNAQKCVFLGVTPGTPRMVVPSALPLKLICNVTRLWRNLPPPSEIFCVRHWFLVHVLIFLTQNDLVPSAQWRIQTKILRGAKYFDFKRATAFNLGHSLSKHKTTRYARKFWGNMASFPPWLRLCSWPRRDKFLRLVLTMPATTASVKFFRN